MVQFTSETPFSLSYKYNQQFVVYFDQLYGASHQTTPRLVLAKLAKRFSSCYNLTRPERHFVHYNIIQMFFLFFRVLEVFILLRLSSGFWD